ncbi:SDR family NAD(P)-dependent oxidoreductase [uncultured Pseudoteredinibacter sp.]|uniref:SDR family NAD(P)-dependent oxidoreductase n=1 Tax=uncultured Pseudoteredinibacter sp. TaxID=1641701 RepID=UPI002626892C|nr:SDR family NAD(P)-dependent oxidoreductase [uncultured Pseudoteredinibacter sp.]
MKAEAKLLVVTGCGGGLGAKLLANFLDQGFHVLAVIRDASQLNEEAQAHLGNRLNVLELDLASVGAGRQIALKVSSLLNAGLSLDAVLFNAAVHYGSAVESMDLDRARDIMDVNFYSVLSAAQCLIPILKKQGFGKLLAISSLSAHIGLENDAIYSASKAALERLFECLDVELAPLGISVGIVIPGAFYSGLIKGSMDYSQEKVAALNEVVVAVSNFIADDLDGFARPGNQQAKVVLGVLSGKTAKERQQLARSWSCL